ncbi:uncharacterized protein HKW66_Vig0114780 [Vigna angularis]|uniref:Uncharacterized protein n=1 Tax=Phaseolus angularis TaxID=3914 RepID=A0A8T0KXX1_PHAAN|nr:uncharacterized protein HKW66_Vig0114780 [Vigna angularis]
MRYEIASWVGVAGWDAAMALGNENGAAVLNKRWRRRSNEVVATKRRNDGADLERIDEAGGGSGRSRSGADL